MRNTVKIQPRDILKKSNGFTIVEGLVSAAMLMIFIFSFASVTTSLQKQNALVEKKLATLEVEQIILKIAADQNACRCAFVASQVPPLKIPSNGATDVTLAGLNNGCSIGAWLVPGSSIPGSQSGLEVADIVLNNFSDSGNNNYSADLKISFKKNSSNMELKPISTRMSFIITAPDLITDCMPPPTSQVTTPATFCQMFPGAVYTAGQGCTLPASMTAPAVAVPGPCGSGLTGISFSNVGIVPTATYSASSAADVLAQGRQGAWKSLCCQFTGSGVGVNWSCLPNK